jgi:tRNA uridine 5-carbamoylmethylation protein Kti12
MKKPKLIMLVGIPGSGKTTVAWNINIEAETFFASTDLIIEKIASALATTYDAIFKDCIDFAQSILFKEIDKHIKLGHDIISDQTNLTVKSRKQKLIMFPENYYKHAIIVKAPPDNILEERLNSRKGKSIPKFIIKRMIDSFETVSYLEGFDAISIYDYMGQQEFTWDENSPSIKIDKDTYEKINNGFYKGLNNEKISNN